MGRNNDDFEVGKYTESDDARMKWVSDAVMSQDYLKNKDNVESVLMGANLNSLDDVENHFKKAGTYTPEMAALKKEHIDRLSVNPNHPTITDGAVYEGILRGNNRHGESRTEGKTYPSGAIYTPVNLDHSSCPFCDHVELKNEDFINKPEIQNTMLKSQQFSDQFFAEHNKQPEDDIDKEHKRLTDGN
jgi:hypothetical protein